MLENSVDFEDYNGRQSLMAQTFKIQLNFHYKTKICFKFLAELWEADDELFE